MSKRIRGVVAVAAAVLLLLSAFPALAAPQLSDVTGHWAADAIQQLVEKGVSPVPGTWGEIPGARHPTLSFGENVRWSLAG